MKSKLKKTNRHLKGSLTIEACIALPFFLCFISIILFFAKLACVDILIEHTVKETAKELAATCYPISIINGYENDLVEKYGIDNILQSQNHKALNPDSDETADKSGLFRLNSIDKGLDKLLSEAVNIGKAGIVEYLTGNYAEDYWLLKNKAFNIAVLNTLNNNLIANKLINADDLKLRLIIFPQGESEYNANKTSPLYKDSDLAFDKDFSSSDVVIQTEYKLSLSIPFIGVRHIKMIHTAMERAWLFGGNGVITSRDEGLDFLEEDPIIVYITKTGIRYHISECRYLHSSKIPAKLEDAAGDGYTPCKVCKPPQ